MPKPFRARKRKFSGIPKAEPFDRSDKAAGGIFDMRPPATRSNEVASPPRQKAD